MELQIIKENMRDYKGDLTNKWSITGVVTFSSWDKYETTSISVAGCPEENNDGTVEDTLYYRDMLKKSELQKHVKIIKELFKEC